MSLECQCRLNNQMEVRYSGDLNAPFLVVGESPGRTEEERGDPFVGESGVLLREELETAGIHEVMFANAARCRINKDILNQREIKEVLTSCRPFLEELISGMHPRIILCVGAIAAEQVLGENGPMRKLRGRRFWSEEFNCHVFVTWHPAYILRNPNERANFWLDINKMAKFAENGYQDVEDSELSWQEVDSIRPLLDGGFEEKDGKFYVTAIDTETQGTLWFDPNSVVISFSVAKSRTVGWQVFLYEETDIEHMELTIQVARGGTKKNPEFHTVYVRKADRYDEKVAELGELCERKDIRKYLMSQKYDVHRLHNLGITTLNNAPMDVALGAHTLDSERFLQPSLRNLIEAFTSMSEAYKEEILESEKEDMLKVAAEDRDRFSKYASYDSIATLNVGIQIKEWLLADPESANYFVNFVQPVETQYLFDMERAGILISQERYPEALSQATEMQSEAEAEFRQFCPSDVRSIHEDNFKLSRRAILMDALFTYQRADGSINNSGYGVIPDHFSPKTELPVCDQRVLLNLLDKEIPDEAKELIEAYQRWSRVNTLITRYFPQIATFLGPDGRIHPTYSFVYTSSGRTGARNPSVQNFPKRGEHASIIRGLVVAPPGKKLLALDMSMSELRWVADVANEPTMKEIFSTGGDIHVTTAKEISRADWDELTDDQRRRLRQGAKAVNFGLVYGMGGPGLASYARTSFGVKLSVQQAFRYRERYFNLYSGVQYWQNAVRDLLVTQGYVRHVLGRKRLLPNIHSDDNWKAREAERIGINFLIQGPSSDYTLLGGKQAADDPHYNPNECRAILFTHDEIVFEVDEDKVLDYAILIKRHLENVDLSAFEYELSVPMVAEAEVGDSLDAMQPLDLGDEP